MGGTGVSVSVGRTGVKVSVGGTGEDVSVAVDVGFGVLVKIAIVGAGVSVGIDVAELQDANRTTRSESNIAMLPVFIHVLIYDVVTYIKRLVLSTIGRYWILFESKYKPEARKWHVSRVEFHLACHGVPGGVNIFHGLLLFASNLARNGKRSDAIG